MGLLYNIVVVVCRIIWKWGYYIQYYSILQCYVEMGWPQLRPQHMIQFLQSHSSPSISFFSSIIYIIIKDQQIYSTSLIFFGPGLSSLRSLDLFVQGLVHRRLAAQLKIFGQMLFGLLFNFLSNNEGPSLIFRKVGLFLERSQYIQWFEKQSYLPSLIFRKVGIKLERY